MEISNENGGLFLDRDGIINEEMGYVWKVEDFRFRKGIFDLAKWAKSRQMPIIVITNQGGIAKGIYQLDKVQHLHAWMQAEFTAHGAPLTEILFCPHHPEINACLCRKPHTLLFERGLAKHRLKATHSIMLGDQQRDLLPAMQLGIKAVYVGNQPNTVTDVMVEDLHMALQWLKSNVQ
jgi:D-glycero-D-manno-heptose 1,7-bisphosphate phosphatase